MYTLSIFVCMSHDMDEVYYNKPKGGTQFLSSGWLLRLFVLEVNAKNDVWSYGMVMYETWSLGHKPFEELNIEKVKMVMFLFAQKVKDWLHHNCDAVHVQMY